MNHSVFESTEEKQICQHILTLCNSISQQNNVEDSTILRGILIATCCYAHYVVIKRDFNLWVPSDEKEIINEFSKILSAVVKDRGIDTTKMLSH